MKKETGPEKQVQVIKVRIIEVRLYIQKKFKMHLTENRLYSRSANVIQITGYMCFVTDIKHWLQALYRRCTSSQMGSSSWTDYKGNTALHSNVNLGEKGTWTQAKKRRQPKRNEDKKETTELAQFKRSLKHILLKTGFIRKFIQSAEYIYFVSSDL